MTFRPVLSSVGQVQGDMRSRYLTLAYLFILVIMLLAALLQVWRESSFEDLNVIAQLKARAAYLEEQLDAGTELGRQLADRFEEVPGTAPSTACASSGPALDSKRLGTEVIYWPGSASSCAPARLSAFADELGLLYQAAHQIGVSRLSVRTALGTFSAPLPSENASGKTSLLHLREELAAALQTTDADGSWTLRRADGLSDEPAVSWSRAGSPKDGPGIAVAVDFPVTWFWQFTLPFEGTNNEVMIFTRDGRLVSRGNGMIANAPGESLESGPLSTPGLTKAQGKPALPAMSDIVAARNRVITRHGFRIATASIGDKPLVVTSIARSRDFDLFVVKRNAVTLGAIFILAMLTSIAYVAIRIVVLRPARRAELELSQISQRLQAIFKTVPMGVCLIEDGTGIVSANQRFDELTAEGPPDSTVQGEASSPDARLGWLVGESDESPSGGRDALTASGRSLIVRWARVHGSKQRVVTVTDITERAKMEAELASARDAAESASRSKAEFLAAMSHEIRTPMNGVVGMVDLMSKTPLSDAQRRSLRTIRESAYALLRIINDILDFSKIEAGRLEIETLETSLVEAVEGAAAPLAIAASTNRLRLLTYIDPSLPLMIKGDPVRIRQILMNLCGNAVKFSKNGEVVVRAEPEPSRAGWVRFCVIDHGIGISEENQKKLFQEFTQAESSTTRRFGGTGLGLAICKRLSEMMGGTIAVSSVLGLGTKFTVSLPLPGAAEPGWPEGTRDFRGHTVILFSRSAEERGICRSYLEFWGASVQELDQPDEVLDRARKIKAGGRGVPLVVFLSDLYASEILGAAARLREIDPQARLVVIRDPGGETAQVVGRDVAMLVDAQPLRRAAFVSAIAAGLGVASPEAVAAGEGEEIAGKEAPSVIEAARSGRLILVAEDNATNRDVIEGQLAQLGYACELAGNGKEAFDNWRSGRFALLLSDCHMPVMDGFELTRMIRSAESERDLERLPIIAITANAMKGEAERCIADGMDDYLAKPVEIGRLKSVLEKWLVQAPAASGEGVPPVLDLALLRGTFLDNEAKIDGILQRFIEIGREILVEIEESFERHDGTALADASHKLKSSALTAGAFALGEALNRLEEAGRRADWTEIASLKGALVPAFDRVKNAVADKLKERARA